MAEELKRELEDLIAEGRFLTSAPTIWDIEAGNFIDAREYLDYMLEEDPETSEALKDLSGKEKDELYLIRVRIDEAENIIDNKIPSLFNELKTTLDRVSGLTHELESYYKDKFNKII